MAATDKNACRRQSFVLGPDVQSPRYVHVVQCQPDGGGERLAPGLARQIERLAATWSSTRGEAESALQRMGTRIAHEAVSHIELYGELVHPNPGAWMAGAFTGLAVMFPVIREIDARAGGLGIWCSLSASTALKIYPKPDGVRIELVLRRRSSLCGWLGRSLSSSHAAAITDCVQAFLAPLDEFIERLVEATSTAPCVSPDLERQVTQQISRGLWGGAGAVRPYAKTRHTMTVILRAAARSTGYLDRSWTAPVRRTAERLVAAGLLTRFRGGERADHVHYALAPLARALTIPRFLELVSAAEAVDMSKSRSDGPAAPRPSEELTTIGEGRSRPRHTGMTTRLRPVAWNGSTARCWRSKPRTRPARPKVGRPERPIAVSASAPECRCRDPARCIGPDSSLGQCLPCLRLGSHPRRASAVHAG